MTGLWQSTYELTLMGRHRQEDAPQRSGKPGNLTEVAMRTNSLKSVFVNAYTRFRLGKLENVCQHFRSYPHQYTLFA